MLITAHTSCWKLTLLVNHKNVGETETRRPGAKPMWDKGSGSSLCIGPPGPERGSPVMGQPQVPRAAPPPRDPCSQLTAETRSHKWGCCSTALVGASWFWHTDLKQPPRQGSTEGPKCLCTAPMLSGSGKALGMGWGIWGVSAQSSLRGRCASSGAALASAACLVPHCIRPIGASTGQEKPVLPWG